MAAMKATPTVLSLLMTLNVSPALAVDDAFNDPIPDITRLFMCTAVAVVPADRPSVKIGDRMLLGAIVNSKTGKGSIIRLFSSGAGHITGCEISGPLSVCPNIYGGKDVFDREAGKLVETWSDSKYIESHCVSYAF